MSPYCLLQRQLYIYLFLLRFMSQWQNRGCLILDGGIMNEFEVVNGMRCKLGKLKYSGDLISVFLCPPPHVPRDLMLKGTQWVTGTLWVPPEQYVPLWKCFSLDQVVKLVSETFNYPRLDREKARMKRAIMEQFPNVGRHFNRIGLRPKVISSFLFLLCFSLVRCTFQRKD
jgi:hypothetical protein